MVFASKPEVQQSASDETGCKSDVFSEDLDYSNGTRQQLYQADDEPDYFTDEESSTGNSKKVSKPGIKSEAYLIKYTLHDPLKTAIREKTLHLTESLLKVISSKNREVSTENQTIPSMISSNYTPFSEALSNSVIKSSLSQEKGFIGNISVHFDSEKSRDAERAPSSFSATTGLFNNNGISPATFPEFPLNFSVSKIKNKPIFASENIEISDFQQDGEKSMEEKISTPFGFAKIDTLHRGDVKSNPNLQCKSVFSNFNTSSVSLAKTNSTESPNLFYRSLKPPVLIDTNSNQSLAELFLTLENWRRRGLDKAFNMPFEDISAHVKKDLQYGLDLMKQMITRICTLMTAANNLPDPDLYVFDHSKDRTRGDLISTGLTAWFSINDLELSVIQAINHLATNPDSIITALYGKLTENLSSLSKEIEEFQKNIRIFCSKIDKIM